MVAATTTVAGPLVRPSFGEALRVWGKIGLINFGGPAGQIALMHRVLIDEKRWIDEARFLHALNYCMLLPGPEALQLATYIGWLLHGTKGGLAAGLLFLLPGLGVLLALSVAYFTLGEVLIVQGVLFGLKAAVLAIVLEALLRVSRRALKGPAALAIAIAAFAAIAFFAVPFPAIVIAAAVVGIVLSRGKAPPGATEANSARAREEASAGRREALRSLMTWGAVWLGPVAVLVAGLGGSHVYSQLALFFSQAAVVTFGGAYAVLAYVAQQAVEAYGWLRPDEMLTGLGLAETTPGPLILVLVFVGFLAGARAETGIEPVTSGLIGALITAWVTFAPSFLFIFAGAPFIERLRGNRLLTGALDAVTAAVVGVIANLALWFGLHVLFTEVGEVNWGPLQLPVPDWRSFDWRAALIAVAAGVALLRFHANVVLVLAVAAAGGAVMRLAP